MAPSANKDEDEIEGEIFAEFAREPVAIDETLPACLMTVDNLLVSCCFFFVYVKKFYTKNH